MAGAVVTSTAAGDGEAAALSLRTFAFDPPHESANSTRLTRISAREKTLSRLRDNMSLPIRNPAVVSTHLTGGLLRANSIQQNFRKLPGRSFVGYIQQAALGIPKIVIK